MAFRQTILLAIFLAAPLAIAGEAPQASTPADLSKLTTAPGRHAADRGREDKRFRFVVMSDRTGGRVPGLWNRAVDQVNLLQPDFVMSVGDYIEGYTTNREKLATEWEEFEARVAKLDAPFFYCPGNHDVSNDVCLDVYEKRHGTKGRSWQSFDYRGCHFVILDASTHDLNAERRAEQSAWLKDDLKNARQYDHVFVFYHQPRPVTSPFPKPIAELCDPKRTTIFNGHEHRNSYYVDEGFPVYVLASTGAGRGESNPELGEGRMYAHVTWDGQKPHIALVPLDAIHPGDYAPRDFIKAFSKLINSTNFQPLPTKDGWQVTLKHTNATDQAATYTLAWTAADGETVQQAATLEPDASIGQFIQLPLDAQGPLNVTYTTSHPSGKDITRQREFWLPNVIDATALGRIEIDGQLGDWQDIPPLRTAGKDMLFGDTYAWTGPEDLSFDLSAGVADKKLCLAIDVRDDALHTEGPSPQHNDAVHIFWDARPVDQLSSNYGEGAGMISLQVPADAEQATPLSGIKGQSLPEGLKTACRRTDSGYVMEVSVPLASLGPGCGENLIRLEVQVTDRDKPEGLGPITRAGAFRKYKAQHNPAQTAYLKLPTN